MATVSDRLVTVFGGTGFLGRRVVRQLRRRGFGVRVASRHADRSQPLFDDSQLQLIKADIHEERSVAEALADAYGAVKVFTLNTGGRPFIPFMSSLPSGSQSRRSEPALSG